MNAKHLLAAAVVLLVVSAVVSGLSLGQAKPAAEPEKQVGRYAVAAWSESTTQFGMIVVCDTKTGQCWTKSSRQDASLGWSDRGSPVSAK